MRKGPEFYTTNCCWAVYVGKIAQLILKNLYCQQPKHQAPTISLIDVFVGTIIESEVQRRAIKEESKVANCDWVMLHAGACCVVVSVPYSLVVTCWERADLLAVVFVVFCHFPKCVLVHIRRLAP